MKTIGTKLKPDNELFLKSIKENRHAMVGPAALWEMKRDFQFQFLKSRGLVPQHSLFDLGCGTLRGGIPLISYLYESHYFGFEVREEVLNEGRKELKEAGLEVKNPTLIHASNITKLNFAHKFDYVWAFSVLIHMSDHVLANTLDFVSKHLLDDGVFYVNVNMGERHDSNWKGFPIVWRTLEFYNRQCSENGLMLTDLGSLRDQRHVAGVESQDQQRMLKITKHPHL
jgi:cyclopropane fatty-acyl-phospholipid synthase-like methyltransferase